MGDKIRQWLGLDGTTPYVKKYFERSNIQASVFMSAIIIFFEVIMIINIFAQINSGNTDAGSRSAIISIVMYVLLFVSAGFMLLYADRYLHRKKDKKRRIPAQLPLWIFCIICIAFGTYLSYFDFIEGEQIFIFLIMQIFVVFLLAWNPIVSIIILTVSFAALYIAISTQMEISDQFKFNYAILWISILVTSVNSYLQKKKEADKDERLEIAYEKQRHDANIDDLTGVYNMNFFRRRTTEILMEPGVHPGAKIILYLDIENFKALNEKYGFQSGNAFLAKFGKKIQEAFEDSVVARQGDDHFVVMTDRKNVRQRLTGLRSILYGYQTGTLIGLKCGGYIPHDDQCDPDVACERARYACASIKKQFDVDYREYDNELNAEFEMRQYIVNNIDNALDRGDIKVYYQPVMWSKNMKLCGYEALTKWEDPKYGILPPGVYIPVLEEYRQVHKIDMIVCETVCKDLRAFMDEHKPAVPVSLNFSRLDFELTDVTEILESFTAKYNIPREYLHVEVTESALSGHLAELQRELNHMKELGYPLWLDDFGSGYSSLNVLKDFDFDVMKIDMKFLSSFESNPIKTKVVIKSIVNMAKELGMRTLCEGVETMEQAEYLKSIGCERLQGYLFGKPMPLEQAKSNIKSGKLPVSEEFIVRSFSGN